MLQKANNLINKAFKDHVDKGGKPYIQHLQRVSEAVPDYGPNHELKVIALLHDILEDCKEWNRESLSQIFNDRIAYCVQILTRNKDEDYFSYIRRIRDSKDGYCVTVKVQDLKDNMDITRLKSLCQTDLERIHKYHKAYIMLNAL
jgi:(p)ppGpp synthase/HD superfamily hydrolase